MSEILNHDNYNVKLNVFRKWNGERYDEGFTAPDLPPWSWREFSESLLLDWMEVCYSD